MPIDLSRRDFARLLQMAALIPLAGAAGAGTIEDTFRIRTITAALEMQEHLDFNRAEAVVAFLSKSRQTFEAKGYQLQTLRPVPGLHRNY